MDIPGVGENLDTCGYVERYITCGNGCTVKPIKKSCQRIECPDCYSDWASKAGHRVSDLLRGVRAAYRYQGEITRTDFRHYNVMKRRTNTIRHFALSPPDGILDEADGIDKAMNKGLKILKDSHSMLGGVLIYHPYRIKKSVLELLYEYMKHREMGLSVGFVEGGLWELVHNNVLNYSSWKDYVNFSPHFHILGFGAFPPAHVFHAKTNGWIYVNLGGRSLDIREDPKTGELIDEVKVTAQYILTHCGIEKSDKGVYRHSRRQFGLCSAKKISLVKDTSGKPKIRKVYSSFLKCPVCGEFLFFGFDDGNGSYRAQMDEKNKKLMVEQKIRFREYEVKG